MLATPAVAQQKTGLVIPATAFVMSQAADWHSTQLALGNGRGHEGNPVMDVGNGGRAAIKVATSIAIVYTAHRLNRSHPRVAKAMLWIGSAATFTVAGNNYRIALK